MVENKIQEEILYREGLQMGLDKDDTIVKRRMAQKVQFLAEDVAAAHEPSTAGAEGLVCQERREVRAPGPRHVPPRVLRLRQARAERPEGRRGRAAQARGPAAGLPARRGDGGCLHVRGLLRRPHARSSSPRSSARPSRSGYSASSPARGPGPSNRATAGTWCSSTRSSRAASRSSRRSSRTCAPRGWPRRSSRPGRRLTRACARGTRCCCPQPAAAASAPPGEPPRKELLPPEASPQ